MATPRTPPNLSHEYQMLFDGVQFMYNISKSRETNLTKSTISKVKESTLRALFEINRLIYNHPHTATKLIISMVDQQRLAKSTTPAKNERYVSLLILHKNIE